jgi:hypothetical protein
MVFFKFVSADMLHPPDYQCLMGFVLFFELTGINLITIAFEL